jgi:mRNA-degrading endonuclease toxin of MazEF toxin-antitoxin module
VFHPLRAGRPTARSPEHDTHQTHQAIPTEVPLDRSDGMPTECVLSVENLGMRRKAMFTEPITRLGPDKMRAVCDALRVATSC